MIVTHSLGKYIELKNPHIESPVWRYVYGGKPKPFFHPLSTPAGHVLTLFEPHDHVWHRGLWFTIKFINGENFWEEKENDHWGTQVTLLPPNIDLNRQNHIAIRSNQEWKRPNGQTIIDEARAFTYSSLDEKSYALDFSISLIPRMDVLLDRTPFTTWGGYGGMTFRGNRNWQQTQMLFDDGTTSDRPTPKHSKWVDLTGKIDGAPNATAGIAMFDHPLNPRHPVGWYGSTGPNHYYNAAFLFEEPLKVLAGKPIDFNYRVLVHDGTMTVDQLQSAYDKWQD